MGRSQAPILCGFVLFLAAGAAASQPLSQSERLTRHALYDFGYYDVDVRTLTRLQRQAIQSWAYDRSLSMLDRRFRIKAVLDGFGPKPLTSANKR